MKQDDDTDPDYFPDESSGLFVMIVGLILIALLVLGVGSIIWIVG